MNNTFSSLKLGVSGIMRVKNDAEFIEASVESCISALDELIIVYNDCSDNSPEIIEKVRLKYRNKIRTYEYKEKVYSINLTKDEYEYAKSLPLDSPHLLCNYYNFALSKVTYKYAIKIDADQIYFTEKLKWWCDVYRGKNVKFGSVTILGGLIWTYSRIVSKINIMSKRILPLMTLHKTAFFWNCYSNFVAHMVQKAKRPVSLSGVDVFKDKDWYVTVGLKNSINNILPPYNGVGDHLIFKVGEDTYYRPDDCQFYNNLRSDSYTLIERFEHAQGNPISIGICWYHINAMRNSVGPKVLAAKDRYPDYFVPIYKFVNLDYNKDIEPMEDKQMVVHYQNILFQFIHQYNAFDIKTYLNKLNNIGL
jgi:hypothetical protein